MHLTLTEFGVKKRFHMEFSEDEAVVVFRRVVTALESGELARGRTDLRPGAEG